MDSDEKAELTMLRKEVKALRIELKKGECLLCAVRKVRYQFVKTVSRAYPINILCRVMKVSLSAHYVAKQKTFDIIDIRHFYLKARITCLFAEHNKRVGSRQMMTLLASEGFKVGRYLVRKLMKALNLYCLQRKSRLYNKKDINNRNKENLLNQCFDPVFPSEAILLT